MHELSFLSGVLAPLSLLKSGSLLLMAGATALPGPASQEIVFVAPCSQLVPALGVNTVISAIVNNSE